MENPQKIDALRSTLLQWFKSNGRHYIPWKLTKDGTLPNENQYLAVYPILVAEVMLQQTQLKVVLPYWEKWMLALPTLVDLAKAEEDKVLLLWQGLGYYSRARRLHVTSRILLNLIGIPNSLNPANWPKDLESWMNLPGIGRNTAGSIISSAFNLPSPLLDGNVKRVLTRLIGSTKTPNKDLARLWKLSDLLLDKNLPRTFNQALMDLGATICTKYNPICTNCPWQNYCSAYNSGNPENLPVKGQKLILSKAVIGVGLILNKNQDVLIDQRLDEGSMGGMWEFPGGKKEKDESIEMTIARELREELGVEVKVGKKLIEFDHSYTHKKLHFIVHLCELISGKPKPLSSQEVRWVKLSDLQNYPFPKANSYMISALKEYFLISKTKMK